MGKEKIKNHATNRKNRPRSSVINSDGKKVMATWRTIDPVTIRNLSKGPVNKDMSIGSKRQEEDTITFDEAPSNIDQLLSFEEPKITYGSRKYHRNQRWHVESEQLLHQLRRYFYKTQDDICGSFGCTEPAVSWCITCDDLGPMCQTCSIRTHTSIRSQTHITRSSEMIGNSTAWIATSTPPWGNVMTLQCKEAGHQSHEASITLIQQYGQRNIRIIKCRCKSWSSALISIGYWPSSPKQPQSAFDIKLMKTYSDFNLMCGTNTYNFSQLLKRISMTKYLSTQKEVYRPLIDSYRPFSAIYNRCLAGTTSLSDPIKVRCPACYYNLGKVHSATFDACFGTVGKMHQNRYPTSPFNANEYMMQDLSKEEVFQHSNEDDLSEKKSGCHRRSTRGPLQKANYYDGLNETGICGSVCKHGVPLYFINIRFGGEKKIFPSVILDKIMEERPNFQLLAKYDSMCVFETWRRNRDMKMPQINALSAGHSLTHEASCQAKYDPTRVLNNGLSSGEEIEANWAKMVSLQLRVREMSSANRHDELTEHLHHIASESVKSLGATLCRQYYKANKTLNHHMVLLRRYRAESGMSDEEALDWYKNYRMARIHKQNNMHLEALEQSRQNLIETNEDALYWLALMRTHDHHNYKTRVTLAQFVMNAVKKRKEALDSFNDIRKWEDPTSPTLTINQCADQGILGQEYFGDNHIEQPKYMHFDALQVVMRAREEIAYTITEIKSILVYASNELQRNRHLQQASADLADQSIRGMYTNNLMNLEKAAGIWISDLADVLHLQGLSSYAPDIKSIINDKTERSMPPGEMLPISDGESDWEKDAIV